jgi:RNA polymerase-binding transcription factor DksA
MLMATREDLERRLQDPRQKLARLDDRLESRGDYGLGQGDPLIVRWEVNLALREEIQRRADRLEEAIDRLDDGDYGVCTSCQKPIDPGRLEALPGTELCIRCARKTQ